MESGQLSLAEGATDPMLYSMKAYLSSSNSGNGTGVKLTASVYLPPLLTYIPRLARSSFGTKDTWYCIIAFARWVC